ncbi:MAG: o-succinylbenzoate synthase, partial [Bacteroidia bacterium]|nr:o-succinylbenzoate synthase [Bacteroidia bacterium]
MIRFGYIKHCLQFAFKARTSRGELKTHDAYLIHATNLQKPNHTGWGEASPLKGLSIDATAHFESDLKNILNALNQGESLEDLNLQLLPAIRFALETAMLDMNNGGTMNLFDASFLNNEPIHINGLIWMADSNTMLAEVDKKVTAGFNCLKFKVGAIDFDEECRMLEQVRKKYSAFKITLRLDANGAFKKDEALQQLKELQRFEIHSIEQPIAAGQPEYMQELCRNSKIKIALDEELIGLDPEDSGNVLLSLIKPAFLILKPTLIGGLNKAEKWIVLANRHQINWWATSALESNIGLNAISQWCSTHLLHLPQGLGTGSLYTNNISSPLTIDSGKLYYDNRKKWILPNLDSLTLR